VYFRAFGEKDYRATVLRCGFDGQNLTFKEAGDELARQGGRGYPEPSLVRFGGRYFLTLRNDTAAYVTTSTDGLRFAEPKLWRWDDGTELGSYNTQAHWVSHSQGLFLVYTRKGAGNDHVFRHRAPLFIAQVDPDKLHVIRATERILLPERGARYGNFGVVHVSADETWVTDSEWMQQPRKSGGSYAIPVNNRWGADAKVCVARIQWKTPNKLFTAPVQPAGK
jgi:hypothetical protein